jgi:DNA polymerase/3'-5' exonuclease PolX
VIKDFPIELMNSAQIAHINGIGKGITKLVDEYMNTGTFKKLRA